jgi:hypothetical protein
LLVLLVAYLDLGKPEKDLSGLVSCDLFRSFFF